MVGAFLALLTFIPCFLQTPPIPIQYESLCFLVLAPLFLVMWPMTCYCSPLTEVPFLSNPTICSYLTPCPTLQDFLCLPCLFYSPLYRSLQAVCDWVTLSVIWIQ